VIAALDFVKEEVKDDDVPASMCDVSDYFQPQVPWEERAKLRSEEIDKMDGFLAFKGIEYSEVPQDATIFQHRWVDTVGKSRLTCKDLKKYSKATEVEVHSPTPSDYSNNCFDWYVTVMDFSVVIFDAVSAFLHATEQQEDCYMYPPRNGSTGWEQGRRRRFGS